MLKLIFNYNCFGLKKEWMLLFFKEGINIFNSRFLGPKQKEFLYYYLRDIELIKNKDNINNEAYFYFNVVFENLYIYSDIFWSLLWINLNFNSNLFWIWNTLNYRKYSRAELLDILVKIYGKINRYVKDGLNSLLSTFEYTPIGRDLKIGIVIKDKKGRSIIKEGGFRFNPYIILYAIYKYSYKYILFEIDIDKIENDLFSPPKVLIVDSKYIKNCLLDL